MNGTVFLFKTFNPYSMCTTICFVQFRWMWAPWVWSQILLNVIDCKYHGSHCIDLISQIDCTLHETDCIWVLSIVSLAFHLMVHIYTCNSWQCLHYFHWMHLISNSMGLVSVYECFWIQILILNPFFYWMHLKDLPWTWLHFFPSNAYESRSHEPVHCHMTCE